MYLCDSLKCPECRNQFPARHYLGRSRSQGQSRNKLIFIDFYTQWCGPCLNMAQTVFSLPTVGYYYNQTFINLKIDAEEGEGITLAKKYGVRSYPTYAFIDPATEEIVHHSSSRQTPEQFIQTGKDATVPTKRSFTCKTNIPKETGSVLFN